ncbi:unnamed protein product [Ilex paraguariensis]|uniref:Uncharacterized protein n=1 Tax=Ilex paraguariensis TaxID=185542 RepID=A0ABC8SD52_9AQUA
MSMTSTSLCSPFLTLSPPPKTGFKHPKRVASATISASRRESHEHNNGGRMVDENLIILRKRIHEMKMIERNYEPPSDWMDWEKSYYVRYDSIICEAMGFLQSQLMNTRPSLALGMIAVIALSLPTSMAVVMVYLAESMN